MSDARLAWLRWARASGQMEPWHVVLREARGAAEMLCGAATSAPSVSPSFLARRWGQVSLDDNCAGCLKLLGLRQRYRSERAA